MRWQRPVAPSIRLGRAAQYLRMSTELQQYSIANQSAAIALYAAAHDIGIIHSFVDEGKSGTTIKKRKGLQELLRVVQSGEADFDQILVYDVSRWGRFPDSDESAHYEYLCKQAGIAVHYCAEQFDNDNSTASNLLKALKRAMAGEFSRELSVKLSQGIVFDAPASYGKHIPEAIAKVTNKPIKMLVYSHIHKDHIGGSVAFKSIPGLQIIALDTVSDFLKEMNDPNRLIPTVTFKTSKTIKLGDKTVELTRHNYHSNEGDLFIYIPEAGFLMVVDSVTSGYVPFQDFDLTTNFHEYMKMFDEILAYKFDNFIGGHLTDTGTRKDVEITKEYTNDVYQTVKRIHNGLNERAFDAEIAKTIGPDNEFLIFKALLDKVTRDSVVELEPRWINRLAGVDVWLPSHVRAALIYVRWDDKE
jgi:glyoxylase-like metal-dependent hydrolase (beta-lactamase superfamily II)